MKSIYDSLIENSLSDMYPMHMPGHKRNSNVLPKKDSLLNSIYKIDITEIDGFDNLHDAETIIRNAEEEAANLWGASKTYFLINGSTSGILAAVSAVANMGDTLIVARNCHKSVFNAAYINRLNLEYIYPNIIEDYDIAGEITVGDVEQALLGAKRNNRKVAAVLVTSPTYDGISSDIASIAKFLQSKAIPFIVDEAHGAHFGFVEGFPKSAVSCGADIVIQSAHKTLPAPTQTALIHISEGTVDINRIKRFLGIYQTSSPSYILMSGLQEAVLYMRDNGKFALKSLIEKRNRINNELKSLKNIKVCDLTEPGKLLISVKGLLISGTELAEVLRKKYQIEVEMAAETYVVCILTVGDTDTGIDRLIAAIKEIDSESKKSTAIESRIKSIYEIEPERAYEYYAAYDMLSHNVLINEVIGMAAADFLYLYPPGIPIMVPGEIFSDDIINKLKELLDKGYKVSGITDNKVNVIWEN